MVTHSAVSIDGSDASIGSIGSIILPQLELSI